jgi:hypothetical protein
VAPLTDFEYAYNSGNYSGDILDAPGNASWPLTHMTFMITDANVTTFDCTQVEEILRFVAWIQTNDEYALSLDCVAMMLGCVMVVEWLIQRRFRASDKVQDAYVAPIDISLRKRLISRLGTVKCNGEQAYSVSTLVGVGPSLTLFSSWSASWSGQENTMKYYQSTSAVAKGLLDEDNEDFGVSINGLSTGWSDKTKDVDMIPAAAFAVVPGTHAFKQHSHRPRTSSAT